MQKASVCPLDCPDTCSLSVTVENDQVVAVRGSGSNPITNNAVCSKVSQYYPAFVHGSNRLKFPLRRIGPKGHRSPEHFERISWPAALQTIYENVSEIIERDGPQAVVPFNYAGPHGKVAGNAMSGRFFNRIGASLLDRAPLCGGIRGTAYSATFGAVSGIPMQQVSAADLIVVWGNNASVSNLHLVRYINVAKRAGAKLVVIDPRRTKIAEQAHLHIALNPGTDVVLALAIAAELERNGGLDQGFIETHVLGADAFLAAAREFSVARAAALCGISEEQISTLAGWYQLSGRAAISIGNGLERNHNGGAAIRAICALPALAGKFGSPGNGLVNAASNAFPTNASLTCPQWVPDGTRTINILDVASGILDPELDPPINALFIYNHNPVIVHPQQNRMKKALLRAGLFTVGIDIAMTDSMHYADIVLPACSHFEHEDIFTAYGQHYLQRAEAVIPPVGESLPNSEIFRRLAVQFKFSEPELRATDSELIDDAFNLDDPRLQAQRPSELATDQALSMTLANEELVLFKNVFPQTPSGKIELESAALADRYQQPVPTYKELEISGDFPLILLTPASDQRTTSTFGGVPGNPIPTLDIHPDDAAARNIIDRQWVRIWNNLGEVKLPARITTSVKPGVVSSDKGAWFHTSDNEQTVSALAPGSKSDIGDGACYNDACVEVTGVA